MRAHGEDLHAHTGDAELVLSLQTDYRTASISAAERAMLDFCVQLTRAPHRMSAGKIRQLRRHGFDDGAILEIVHITGFFNYINRVADALGVDPEPDWESPTES